MNLLNMLCAQSAKTCMITKTASRTVVEGKFQLDVSLYHGQDTHTGIAEVRNYLAVSSFYVHVMYSSSNSLIILRLLANEWKVFCHMHKTRYLINMYICISSHAWIQISNKNTSRSSVIWIYVSTEYLDLCVCVMQIRKLHYIWENFPLAVYLALHPFSGCENG